VALTELDRDVEASAAPAAVRAALDRLADRHAGLVDRLTSDDAFRSAIVAVLGASRSLTRLLEADDGAIEVLASLDRRPALDASDDALLAWKQREYLRIAARDLLGIDVLEGTTRALAALAGDVFEAALRSTGAAGHLAVIGMGKLGGAELNYASDVDVVFVGDGLVDDRTVRNTVAVARRCFRVDLNLRPEGRDGPLVRTLDSYRAYWERWAQPWEAQALLKARSVAGPAALGRAWADAAAEWLWTRPFGADDLRSVRNLKERAEAEVARLGLTERELKRGRGGIRDVEFAVQLLQLVHGGVDPELRSPNTLTALAELADAGYVGRADADRLAAAYRFLRTVEHRLQMVDEQQVHAVPNSAADREHLARVLGYRGTAAAAAVEQFDADLRGHQAAVRAIHERLWFRPLLEAFADPRVRDAAVALRPEVADARLAAFGFIDAARTRQAVAELTRGLTRSSRLMQQLLPLVLDWLSAAPDPDIGLLGLRTLASGPQRSMQLAATFRESPEAARRLCLLLGTSRKIGLLLERNPEVITALIHPDDLRLRSRDELIAGARQAVAWRTEADGRRRALNRYADREGLRVMAADVLEFADVATVGYALTDLAESALDDALAFLGPRVSFAIIAMGRFGGRELSYASDLDILFVYDGTTAADFAEAERVAEGVLRFIGGTAPHIYDIDPDLRPEGKQGPLARSFDGYRTYYDRWAEPWERLAMVRARPAVGDPEVGARFLDVVSEFVGGGLTDADRREIRRVKARVERERIPAGDDPQFHLKLGRGSLSDIEFTAQLLQLEHGVRTASTNEALDRLATLGALDTGDRAVLGEAYRFCERTRNRWFLVNNGPGDSLPQQPERLARLARSLDTTAAELRDDYRRVTRRSRRVVERLFYGRR
jgi:glutamate-ammonia-ligase adenylyltransferase